jgi:hypothetical protein
VNPYTAEPIKGRRRTLKPLEQAMNTYNTGKRSFKINIKDESFPPSQRENPSHPIETGYNSIAEDEVCPTCQRISPLGGDSSFFGSIVLPSEEVSPAVL